MVDDSMIETGSIQNTSNGKTEGDEFTTTWPTLHGPAYVHSVPRPNGSYRRTIYLPVNGNDIASLESLKGQFPDFARSIDQALPDPSTGKRFEIVTGFKGEKQLKYVYDTQGGVGKNSR